MFCVLPWWLAAAFGCFIDNPGAPPAAGASGSKGSSSGASASGAGGGGPSLCERQGGYEAVAQIVGDFRARLAADCRIGAFFAPLSSEQQQHFGDCLTKQ